MVPLQNKKEYLKKLKEKVESTRQENAQMTAELSVVSLKNDFLEKNVEWFKVFLELEKVKDARRSELLESISEDRFLFGDLLDNILEKTFSNTSSKKDEFEPLVETMDNVIKDTESVMEFYNNIPIVQTYKKLYDEYQKSEEILKSLKEKNPTVEEQIKNYDLLLKQRNRIIVTMVTKAQQITNSSNYIQKIKNDLEKKNELLNDLKEKLQALQKQKNDNETIRGSSKFTLSHIDIFKIPSFPVKTIKNSVLMQSKSKENDKKSNLKKSVNTNKAIPTFPILPLHRNNNKNNLLSNCEENDCINNMCENSAQSVLPVNVEIIDNILIKNADSKPRILKETSTEVGENSNSPNKLLNRIEMTDSTANMNTSKLNINDDENIRATITNNKTIPDNNNLKFNEENSKNCCNTTESKEKPNDSVNITLTSFMDSEKTSKKRKFINKSKIPIENISKTDALLKKFTNENCDSKANNSKKRIRFEQDCLSKKELIINVNQDASSSKCAVVKNPIENLSKEKSPKKTSVKEKSPKKQPSKEKSPKQNPPERKAPSKDELFNMYFDGISLGDSENSVKDFTFGDENMNFDEMGNENNLLDSGDLNFASDNQFAENCDSFKF